MELKQLLTQDFLPKWFETKCKQCRRMIYMDVPENWNPYENRYWDGEFYSGFYEKDMYDLRHYGC